MALVLADRVQDTTTTTGTGSVTLTGTPPAGYQSFGTAIGNGNTTYYTINGGSEWEVGVGTYIAAGTSLSRDTVLSSSNSGNLVNFSAGTKIVFVTYPAEKSVNEDVSGNVNIDITGNAATATRATNLYDGAAGSIPYQTAANTTAFVAAASGVLVGGTTPSFSTTPTLTGTNFTAIPNSALSNNAVTIGTTAISLGATSLTLAGLTSVTLTQDPTLALQAATKQYVDGLVASGIHFHQPVRVESPTNLNATYSNGSSGVGATLTNAGAQAALVIDGVTVNVADRVLIYQQTTQTQNGIYVVTSVGSGSTNWVLTRSSDANTYVINSANGLSEGSTVFVQEGATGAGETYTCNTSGVITFGTTNITFAQISSAQIYSAGVGLTLTGTQFSLTTPVATTLGGTGLTTYGAANRAIYSSGATTLVAGTLPTAAGGTGHTSYTDGQILIGKSSDGTLDKATLTAGTGISITNGSASITITNTAPNQVVSITGGGTTVVTGSYPNFSVTSADQYVGTVTSVSGAGTVNGLTLTGTVTSTGSITLGGTLSVNLATDVTGTLPVSNGGLGVSTLTSNAVIIGNGTSGVLSVAPGTTGNVLTSSGSAWVSSAITGVNLTSQVTGTLPVANGGTGATTLTGVIIGNGTSAFTTVTAPSGAIVGTTDTQNLTNKTLTTGNTVDAGTSISDTGTIAATSPGFRGLPQNSRTASYTLALTDAGKHISNTTGGFVIPANSSVAFPIGTTIVLFNNSGSTQTISITTDTLRQAGSANTGTRTLAIYGLATCVKIASTTWVINGNVT